MARPDGIGPPRSLLPVRRFERIGENTAPAAHAERQGLATPLASCAVQEDARALVGRYWDGLWRHGDLSVVDELIGEPYVRHSSAGTRTFTHAEFKQELTSSWRLLHQPTTTVDDQVVDGDKVWTRATTRGVNIDTGEPVVLTWLVVHRLSGGRLVESWSATLPGVDWR